MVGENSLVHTCPYLTPPKPRVYNRIYMCVQLTIATEHPLKVVIHTQTHKTVATILFVVYFFVLFKKKLVHKTFHFVYVFNCLKNWLQTFLLKYFLYSEINKFTKIIYIPYEHYKVVYISRINNNKGGVLWVYVKSSGGSLTQQRALGMNGSVCGAVEICVCSTAVVAGKRRLMPSH